MKFNVFIITWSIFSNKYVKRLVLINHNWISLILQKRWGSEFCLFFKKWGRVYFSPKKGEVGKVVEEWSLLRENNLSLLANLCVYNSKKHYNPRYIHKSFNIYPNFWDRVLSQVQISEIYINIIHIPVGTFLVFNFTLFHGSALSWSQTTYLKKTVSLIVFRHKFYQNLACGTHFQFNSHGLLENVEWN